MILEYVENQILYHIQQGPVPPGGQNPLLGFSLKNEVLKRKR